MPVESRPEKNGLFHRSTWMNPALPGWILLAHMMLASTIFATDEPRRTRTFKLSYEATANEIPDGTKVLDFWMPVPSTDRNQTIHKISFKAPGPIAIEREPRFGNNCLHLQVASPQSPVVVTLMIEATRMENAGWLERLSNEERKNCLTAEPLVPLDGPILALALEATRGLSTEREKARAIYDKVTGMMKYDKTGTGWGRGDALFACDAKRGNCTDFHALIIGMCRSIGIPARFSIGFPLPLAHGQGEIPGYHCWAELYVAGSGWVPVDSSEAAKNPKQQAYFFGHHDENRLEFSRGRHLTLAPPQQGKKLNFFVYPYAEADGKPLETISRKITFIDRNEIK